MVIPAQSSAFEEERAGKLQMFGITSSPTSGQGTTSSSPQEHCTREVNWDDGWKQQNETHLKWKFQHLSISDLPRALFGAHEPNQPLPACARAQGSQDVFNRQQSKHSMYIVPSCNLPAEVQAIKAAVAWLWGLIRGHETSPLKTEIHIHLSAIWCLMGGESSGYPHTGGAGPRTNGPPVSYSRATERGREVTLLFL